MGPVIFITGSGKGLGKDMALAFSSEGYRVAVTGDEGTAETAAEIRRRGGQPLDLFVDLRNPEQVEKAVEEVLGKWGQIDVLVNNAGIEGPTAPLVEVSSSDWEDTLRVNLTGAFLCDRAIAPHMMSRRSGCIIHISSVGGMQAYPLRSPYAVSKRGLIALTETLAAELGPYQVRVNAVCPGPVKGQRMDRVITHRAEAERRSKRKIEDEFKERAALLQMVGPDDVVALVVFLASAAARNITGQAIRVCGGYQL